MIPQTRGQIDDEEVLLAGISGSSEETESISRKTDKGTVAIAGAGGGLRHATTRRAAHRTAIIPK